jgi:hypothetical protein
VRPVGSTNGRKPPGGYPRVSDYLAGLIAGLIAAEGCFSIAKQTRGFGYQPDMSIRMRADDGRLLETLARRTKLGRTTAVPARRTSREQVDWSVFAKADCQRLVEILDGAPMLGRKAEQYAIWRKAVLRWVGQEVRGRLKPCDWTPFAVWKEELAQHKRYAEHRGPIRDAGASTTGGWQPFLAGFATGVACFDIDHNGRPRYTINLRAAEVPLLACFQRLSGLGRIYGPYARRGPGNPTARWVMTSSRETVGLIALFDECPPSGRKRLEYEVWAHAVLERAAGAGWRRDKVAVARSTLRGLR